MNHLKAKLTSKDSLIKTLSSKPIKYAIRDAFIAMTISLFATVVIMMIYYHIMGQTADWASLIGRTLLTSFIMSLVYEYSGFNSMICESAENYSTDKKLTDLFRIK